MVSRGIQLHTRLVRKSDQNLPRQSHHWPQSLSYPLKPSSSDEFYTSSMIPVSHLAREGLVPITMGMVLCNEPADRIDPYVKMVHGLHAEGVVR